MCAVCELAGGAPFINTPAWYVRTTGAGFDVPHPILAPDSCLATQDGLPSGRAALRSLVAAGAR
eukprot:COSAG05_NODE_23849_length_255_cov_0.666667_1_plen_63_part_01